MKKTVIMWMILAVLFSACGGEGNNGTDTPNFSSGISDKTFRVSEKIGLSENDITESGETVSEESVSFNTALGEGSETAEQPAAIDAEERDLNYWFSEPDPQDTLMLCVEGNISANQAWVDFLKGEMPDYTGVDFTSGRYSRLGRPYTLQDMEGYSLDFWAYGETEYAACGGRLTSIQIFPYDIDADGEEELLFICDSYAGMVELWVLDEAYEDAWLLYPSTSNWAPPGVPGRAWLWSDGFTCRQDPDLYVENCPDCIYIFRIGEGLAFKLECNQYWSSDTTAVYYLTYEDEDDWITVKVMFDRNGAVVDGSLIYAENVFAGPDYDDDLAIITQIYEESVGDAVPVRELIGLDGIENGVIIVTREEFYSGAYLE